MSSPFDRVVLVVLDGVGVGALPDADLYDDVGANTLAHVAHRCEGLSLPHMQALGLGNILPLAGVPETASALGAFGKMAEASCGKDSTTGHWEMCGILQETPLPSFPQGFPSEIIQAFSEATGIAPLGNLAISGTEVLRLLGEEHLRTGRPIVYTSVDSVFQIAAHEEVIPKAQLYDFCQKARKILDPWRVGRVIARPFVGSCADDFVRSSGRHDFSLPPVGETLLDLLQNQRFEVSAVGKISDIFCARGIDRFFATDSNTQGMSRTLEAFSALKQGLVFTNLIDFDMEYGHRLDATGFGSALEAFDCWLPEMMSAMGPRDLLLISADHGCDPTTEGTDHSREYVPVLAWSPTLQCGADLGTRSSFCDLGATIAEALGCSSPIAGTSFLSLLPLQGRLPDSLTSEGAKR